MNPIVSVFGIAMIAGLAAVDPVARRSDRLRAVAGVAIGWLALQGWLGPDTVREAIVDAALGKPAAAAWHPSPVEQTTLIVDEAGQRVALYSANHGVPDSTAGLGPVFGGGPVPTDAWGTPLAYFGDPETGFYDVVSLGSDRQIGGEGAAADIHLVHSN